MSRSGMPTTIFLEFRDKETLMPRVIGTDAIFFIDGRWSRDTVECEAYNRADEIAKGRNIQLYAYSIPGDYSGKVYHF